MIPLRGPPLRPWRFCFGGLPGRPLNRGVLFRKVTIVGVGLLGGSIGLALQKRELATTVCGVVRRPEAVQECVDLGVVTHATRSLAVGVQEADLVVLCSPIGEMARLLGESLPHLSPDAVVTDVGSVKGAVVESLETLAAARQIPFVGSHPMAGAEKTGPSASRADLFDGATCVVTATPRTDPTAQRRVVQFWEALGGRVMVVTPQTHDELVARSSHLPHVLAAGLANYVLSPSHPEAQARVCAGGFRDATRVAEGPPAMWRDIALANRKPLSRALAVLMADLAEFRRSLDEGDAPAVEEFFAEARKRRSAWSRPPAG